MSFILNALRKSEQERQKLQVNSLSFDQAESPVNVNRRKMVIYSVIFVAVNLILTVGIISLVRSPAEVFKLEVKEKPENGLIKPQEMVSQSQLIKLPETDFNSELIKPVEKTIEPDKSAALPNAPIANTSIADLIEEKSNVISESEPPKTKTVTAKPEVINNPVRAPKIENRPQATIVEATPEISLPKETLPYLRELPFAFQQNVPDITINVFVYSDQPSECFVMIDGVKYKIGQSLPNAIHIKDITTNSLVVEYQNKTFQVERH